MSVIKEIREQVTESTSALKPWRDKAKVDAEMYLGRQWTDKQMTNLSRSGKFSNTYNVLAKHLMLVSGYERRNRSDIKALPIEGADDPTANVITAMIKWLMAEQYVAYHASEAFLHSLITGLGFVTLDVRRDLKDLLDDPLGSGELVAGTGNPFQMLWDPQWSKIDMSDCAYMMNSKRLTPQQLKYLYPSLDEDIDSLKKGSRLIPEVFRPHYEDHETIEVIERWQRTYEKRCFMVDIRTGEATEGVREELEEFIAVRPDFEHLRILEGQVDYIKYDVLIDDTITFGGENPIELNNYPFIPFKCFHNSIHPDSDLRHYGMVRPLLDSQRHINKLLSEVLDQVTRSAWKRIVTGYPNIEVTDDELINPGGTHGVSIIRVPDVSQYTEIPSQTFDPRMLDLSNLFLDLMGRVGNNPDLMGQQGSAGTPGIAIQLRQSQGEMSNEPIFDNYRLSLEQLGRSLIELTGKVYSLDKVKRIVGNEVEIPEEFDTTRQTAKFDVSVNLFGQAPTFRYAQYMQIIDMMEKGLLQPSPQLADAILTLSDLSPELKEQFRSAIRQTMDPPQGPPNPQGMPQEGPPVPNAQGGPVPDGTGPHGRGMGPGGGQADGSGMPPGMNPGDGEITPEFLEQISQQTGQSPEELLSQLTPEQKAELGI